MIINHQILDNKYKCGKLVMEYLVYQHKLPLLSFEGGCYYFANTDKLRKAIREMPLSLKVASALSK